MWSLCCIHTTRSGIPWGYIYFCTDIPAVRYYHVEYMCMCYRLVGLYQILINKHWKGQSSLLQVEAANKVDQKHVTQTQAKLRVRGKQMLHVRNSKELSCKDVQTALKAHPASLGFFPGVRRPGSGSDQPPSSSVWVELQAYLILPSVPARHVNGQPYLSWQYTHGISSGSYAVKLTWIAYCRTGRRPTHLTARHSLASWTSELAYTLSR
jgi:hypothetical protein